MTAFTIKGYLAFQFQLSRLLPLFALASTLYTPWVYTQTHITEGGVCSISIFRMYSAHVLKNDEMGVGAETGGQLVEAHITCCCERPTGRRADRYSYVKARQVLCMQNRT